MSTFLKVLPPFLNSVIYSLCIDNNCSTLFLSFLSYTSLWIMFLFFDIAISNSCWESDLPSFGSNVLFLFEVHHFAFLKHQMSFPEIMALATVVAEKHLTKRLISLRHFAALVCYISTYDP